jgi:Uma2 family endonuclease
MSQTARKPRRYTYKDYLGFPDDCRCEIIDGELYDMTPSPTSKHQSVSGEIYRRIRNHLKEHDHPCQVFNAPLDVVLAEDQVVQPDVFIVCDREKVKQYIFGAPDAVFEIVSPSTTLKDRREKMRLYERFGVNEYFLVDPESEFIEKYALLEGKYNVRVGIYAEKDRFHIEAIGLEIIAGDLFAS